MAEADRNKPSLARNRDCCSTRRVRSPIGNQQGEVTLVEFFDYNAATANARDRQLNGPDRPEVALVLRNGQFSRQALEPAAVAVRCAAGQSGTLSRLHQRCLPIAAAAARPALAAAKLPAPYGAYRQGQQSPESAPRWKKACTSTSSASTERPLSYWGCRVCGCDRFLPSPAGLKVRSGNTRRARGRSAHKTLRLW